MGEQMSCDHFLSVLNDKELELKIRERFPGTLDETFKQAVQELERAPHFLPRDVACAVSIALQRLQRVILPTRNWRYLTRRPEQQGSYTYAPRLRDGHVNQNVRLVDRVL